VSRKAVGPLWNDVSIVKQESIHLGSNTLRGADSKLTAEQTLTKMQNFSPVARAIGTGERPGPFTIPEFKLPMCKSCWITVREWLSSHVEWPNAFMSRARRWIF
jgi:hypothetical protein